MTDEDFMRLAIEKAKVGIENGQTPFGSCVVKDGEVVSCEHGLVLATYDVSAHAEIMALRVACKKLNTIDLSGCTMYTTCASCIMCFGANNWANISRLVYGVPLEAAVEIGFNELLISPEKLKEIGNSPIEIVGGVLAEECLEPFNIYAARSDKRVF